MGLVNSSGSVRNAAGANGASAGSPRLICAVSTDERRLFLRSDEERAKAPPAEPVWIETNGDRAKLEQLAALNPEIILTGWSTGALPARWIESRDCALRYVCHLTGSVRGLVPRAFIERGGLVTNWGEIPSTAVAEHALMLALTVLRNMSAWPGAARYMHDTAARIEWLNTRSLFGRRVGLHGFGRIARALVPLLRPFGVTIEAFSAGVPDTMMRALNVMPCTSLEQLLARNEIIFECEGLTPATAGCVSGAMLATLRDGAVFVNVARGQLVDEAALVREAASGRISVALDVVATAPWDEMAAAFRAAGAVVAPHIGGPTFDQYQRCGEFALQNVARFIRGEAPEGQVSLADYDRAT